MVTHFSPMNGRFNGVFAFINQNYHDSFYDYVNCISTGSTESSPHTYQEIFPPKDINRVVQASQLASYTFTFQSFYINVTSYSLKGSFTQHRTLSDWTLKASYNGSEWKTIHQVSHCDDCYLHPESNNKLSPEVFNSFKITKINDNQEDDGTLSYYFDLYGFEIFGTICNPISCAVIPDFFCTIGQKLKLMPSLYLFISFFAIL